MAASAHTDEAGSVAGNRIDCHGSWSAALLYYSEDGLDSINLTSLGVPPPYLLVNCYHINRT